MENRTMACELTMLHMMDRDLFDSPEQINKP